MSTRFGLTAVVALCTYILINDANLVVADSLFSHDSDVVRLSTNNFSSIIYGSSQLWMVDFYAAWCGACQRFAPVYSSFATSIKDWSRVVGLAVVSCSDSTNDALCRKFVSGYPTVRMFPPAAVHSHRGLLVEGHKTASLLHHKLLQYMTRLLHHGRGHPSWPRLGFIRHASELLSGVSGDSRHVYVIVEDRHAERHHIGQMVILDLLPLASSVTVGRMRLNDVAMDSVTGRGLYTTTKFNTLYPVSSEFERGALVETIQQRVGGRSIEVTMTTVPVTAAPAVSSSTTAADGLHMQDIESGLYYSLWSEIPTRESFGRQDMSALRLYIDVLYKYLPAEDHVVNFLRKLNRWLETAGDELSTNEWINRLNYLQEEEAYIAHHLRWTGCRGSQPRYRGYPCSLWMTLHAVTVNAYIREINNTRYSPVEVISAIRGYVQHFLSCHECAENFGRGTARLLSGRHSSRYFTSRDGAVIWLWKSHNRANRHLRGDITEDPAHPKLQFPSATSCPACHHDSSWNETAVLQYLVEYYGAASIIDDDIDSTAEGDVALTHVTATVGRCEVVSSDWTPCSRSCDVGTSIRLTNDNQDCRMQTQLRLCLVRPCAVRFPDWSRSAWHRMNCARLGHTYQLSGPHSLQLGNCSTQTTTDRWRVCGRCPSSPVSGRPVCCRPARSSTRTVTLQCPARDVTLIGDVMVDVIEFCSCDDNCLPGEL